MEIATLGSHHLAVCPYCDALLETRGGQEVVDLFDVLQMHYAASPSCKEKADAAPSLLELCDKIRPDMERAEQARQKAIAEHPDNGQEGYWLVTGVRHDARTWASSAREAIEKCADVVQSWESPEASFWCEELPDVF